MDVADGLAHASARAKEFTEVGDLVTVRSMDLHRLVTLPFCPPRAFCQFAAGTARDLSLASPNLEANQRCSFANWLQANKTQSKAYTRAGQPRAYTADGIRNGAEVMDNKRLYVDFF
ncbi:hypothetical protein SprV_0100265600 [Sparganum proliferum]